MTAAALWRLNPRADLRQQKGDHLASRPTIRRVAGQQIRATTRPRQSGRGPWAEPGLLDDGGRTISYDSREAGGCSRRQPRGRGMPLEEAGRPGDLWLIEGPLGGLRSGGRCGAVRAPARLKAPPGSSERTGVPEPEAAAAEAGFGAHREAARRQQTVACELLVTRVVVVVVTAGRGGPDAGTGAGTGAGSGTAGATATPLPCSPPATTLFPPRTCQAEMHGTCAPKCPPESSDSRSRQPASSLVARSLAIIFFHASPHASSCSLSAHRTSVTTDACQPVPRTTAQFQLRPSFSSRRAAHP